MLSNVKKCTTDDNQVAYFQGWFSATELYYGYYTNQTIHINSTKKYKMQVAYLFTCGGYYLLTLVILGHRSVKGSGKLQFVGVFYVLYF